VADLDLEKLAAATTPLEFIEALPDKMQERQLEGLIAQYRNDVYRRWFDAQGNDEPLVWTTAAERRARPAMAWLIRGLAPAGGTLGVMFGPQFVGKSLLVDDLALTLWNGLSSWMGFEVVPDENGEVPRRHAGIILLEGAVGIQARIDAWLAAHPDADDEGVLTLERQAVDLRSEASIQRIIDSVKDAKVGTESFEPAFIAVDTQGLALPGTDENSRSDMRQAYRLAKRLANELKCLVLLITHPGHQYRHRPAGASTQEQDADLSIRVEAGWLEVKKVKEGESGVRRSFEIVKAAESAYARYLDNETPLGRLAAEAQRFQDSIICAVRRLQDVGGVRAARIFEAVGGSKAVFYQTVAGLIEAGRLQNLSTTRTITLFTQEEATCP
jgi:hypothetical protein